MPQPPPGGRALLQLPLQTLWVPNNWQVIFLAESLTAFEGRKHVHGQPGNANSKVTKKDNSLQEKQ